MWSARCHPRRPGRSPRRSSLNSPARLVLLSRPECGLCEEFELALAAFAREQPLPALEKRDVDSDPLLARRYGLDIPVLLLDGQLVCRHAFDPAELQRLLRPR